MDIEDAWRLMYDLDHRTTRSLDYGYQSYIVVTNHDAVNPEYGVISYSDDAEDTMVFTDFDEIVDIWESEEEYDG